MRAQVRAMFGLGLAFCATAAANNRDAPWGHAAPAGHQYRPAKVVYDVQADTKKEFARVLDHVAYLKEVNGANPLKTSIVVVLHGEEIGLFAIDNYLEHERLMKRARGLTMDGTVAFRVCEVAAEKRGYKTDGLHGFVQTVPMADAEIIRLQRRRDYAYMEF